MVYNEIVPIERSSTMRAHTVKRCSLCLALLLAVSLFTVLTLTVSADAPEIHGDASRLTVDKASYAVGEPIMVSGIGSGTDWLGIYRVDAPHSIRWTYVDTARGGPGSGVSVNMRTVPDVNGGEPLDIPAGTYIIRLMANDSSNFADCIAWTTITVGEGTIPDTGVSTPVSAGYRAENDTDGYATGTVTVKMPMSETQNRSIVMYWANADGKLAGYTALGRFKVTGETTEFTFGQNVLIPEGATRLLVYAMNDGTGEVSPSCAAIDLPKNAAHQMPTEKSLGELFIMSDIHITLNTAHTHNQNFAHMLSDVASLNKDALGIFVVGDMADTGNEQEYKNMVELYTAAGDVPPIFLAVGNHDLSSLPFDQANALFLKYATLPDGSHPTDTSYDFWLGGYHFIFLGTDHAAGVHSSFERATMTWLEEKINENRDPARPVFLFLHQSLSNTVSGSLPGEGWSGVNNENMLRKALEDYPEVMLFNGHSHWTMDSVGNMFEGDEKLPCRIFNCASVAYLWSGYRIVSGEHLNGSQGYMVKLYDGKLYVLGRDFAKGEWISSAQYCIELVDSPEPPADGETTAESQPVDTPAETDTPTDAPTETHEPADTPNDTVSPDRTPSDSGESNTSPDAKTGCGAALSLSVLCLLLTAAILVRKSKKRD